MKKTFKGIGLSKEGKRFKNDAIELLSHSLEALKTSMSDVGVGLVVAITKTGLALIDKELDEIILKEGE